MIVGIVGLVISLFFLTSWRSRRGGGYPPPRDYY
jgi:hypothetical protein